MGAPRILHLAAARSGRRPALPQTATIDGIALHGRASSAFIRQAHLVVVAARHGRTNSLSSRHFSSHKHL